MNKRVKQSLIVLALAATFCATSKAPIVEEVVAPADSVVAPADSVEVLVGAGRTDKQICSEKYPVPMEAVNWTNCRRGSQSACGGPDQCACPQTERLFNYVCDQGSFAICEPDRACE